MGGSTMLDFTIVHTMGRETITVDAESSDEAYAKALSWALSEGLVILRCIKVQRSLYGP